MSDDVAQIDDDRLFHALGVVTGNALLTKVDRQMVGTVSVVVADEQRWQQPSMSVTLWILSAR